MFILVLTGCKIFVFHSQSQTVPDFKWGNASYFNVNTGDTVFFNEKPVQLLKLHNHYNQIKIGEDSIWLKVSRRTLPVHLGGLRIFVVDNKNIKAIDTDKNVHGLMRKDALLCISGDFLPLLDPVNYTFPISFNDGFLWSTEEESYMFSFTNITEGKTNVHELNPGVDFDLSDARGIKKHWTVAFENSKVVWVDDKKNDVTGKTTSVLLESESQPGIYFLYDHLDKKNVEVKPGQKLLKGERISTVWGDETWGHLTFSVIKSDTVPAKINASHNLLNCFPQLFELYFKQTFGYPKSFSKGRIYFGKTGLQNRNQKNSHAYEPYTGKGWVLGKWNIADKVETVAKGTDGNVRLSKKLFTGTPVACTNPNDFYDYEINVINGVYRIRARMGDAFVPTWQKISFEGVDAGIIETEKAGFNWTPERVVKIDDGKLTVRIYIDGDNIKPGGIAEIVFQQAY